MIATIPLEKEDTMVAFVLRPPNKRRAIFIDRDGTINVQPEKGDYVKSVDELVLKDEVIEALARLSHHAPIIIVSNQRGVSLGLMTVEDLWEITSKIDEEIKRKGGVGISVAIYSIDYGPFRKPEPGMLLWAAERFGIDLEHSFMIGDHEMDRKAAINAGIPPEHIFIDGDDISHMVEELSYKLLVEGLLNRWIIAREIVNLMRENGIKAAWKSHSGRIDVPVGYDVDIAVWWDQFADALNVMKENGFELLKVDVDRQITAHFVDDDGNMIDVVAWFREDFREHDSVIGPIPFPDLDKMLLDTVVKDSTYLFRAGRCMRLGKIKKTGTKSILALISKHLIIRACKRRSRFLSVITFFLSYSLYFFTVKIRIMGFIKAIKSEIDGFRRANKIFSH